MAGNSADIGIRIFLDDAASQGLYAVNNALGSIGTAAMKANAGFGSMSQGMAMLGMVSGFSASLLLFGGAIKQAVDDAASFQTSMFSVAVATHVSMDEAMQYSDKLMNLGANSIYSSQQIADGVAILGRSGYTIQQIFDDTTQAEASYVDQSGKVQTVTSNMAQAGIELGIAIRSSASDGFKLLAQVMAAYQAPADQATHYANLLQYAFEHQTGSVSQLQSGLASLTPAAVRLGVPFREVVAALDTVGPAMGNTSMAGTALRYAMQAITSPTSSAIKALADVGLITVSSTNPAVQAFTANLIKNGGANADFVKANSNSVKGLQNMFVAAQQAGIIPLDAKFEEWAAGSGMLKNAFFDASGKAKDFGQDLQLLADKTKNMNGQQLASFLKDVFSVRGGQGIQILLQQLQKYNDEVKKLNQTHDNANGVAQRFHQQMDLLAGAWKGLQSSVTDLSAAIGLHLLPTITPIVKHINEVVSAVRGWVEKNPEAAATFLKLGAALSVVGVIVAFIAMAFMGIMPPILLFLAIMAAVVAGTVLLSLGLTLLIGWVKQTAASTSPLGAVFRGIGAVFHDLGSFIGGVFTSTWNNLKQAFAPLGPAFGQLGAATRPLLPILGLLAAVIGGVLVGAIRGIIQALGIFITGLAHIIVGIILIFTGIITASAGFWSMFIGLFTGNWALFRAGWQSVMNGVGQIFSGGLHLIIGIITATLGTIIGFIVGFVTGVIGFFQHLFNVLVGHSIIPDMLNMIRSVFMSVLNFLIGFVVGFIANLIGNFIRFGSQIISTVTNAFNQFRSAASIAFNMVLSLVVAFVAGMIGRIISFGAQLISNGQHAWNGFRNAVSNGINNVISLAQGLPGRVMNAIANLGTTLFNSGSNFMHMFANGITAGITWVTDAAHNVANTIMNLLEHKSPAKMGPLANDDKWMPNMMRMFAQGIHDNVPLLQNASLHAAGGIASAPSTARLGAPSVGGGSAGSSTVNLVLDGNILGQVVINHLTGQMQLNGLGRAFR